MGIFFTLGLFREMIVLQAVLILSISDSLSTLFGKKYGKVKIYNSKSVLGSLVFFSSAFFIEFIFQNFLTSLVVAFVATFVEILPADDNITIPLAVGAVLRFIPSLPY
jgi:dolichol kinase